MKKKNLRRSSLVFRISHKNSFDIFITEIKIIIEFDGSIEKQKNLQLPCIPYLGPAAGKGLNPDPSQNQDQDPDGLDTCFEDRRKSLALSTHRSHSHPDVSLPLSLFKLFPQKSPEETEDPSQLNLDTQELKIARDETETFSRSSPSAALTSRMKKPKERYNLSMDLNNSVNTEPNKEVNDSLSLKEKKSVRFGSVPVSEVGSFLRDSPVHQSSIRRLQSLTKGPRDKDSLSEKSDKTLRKSSFGAATLLKKLSINTTQKAPNVSITFDAYVDKHKGERQEMSSFLFPSYKKDKRMEFLGRRFVYPEFIIPEKSKWRKNWNVFIILLILYEVVWYPMSATFFFDWDVPKQLQTLDWLLVMTYAVDIIFNLRTTYCNAESEEIIDDVMIRKNYLKSSYFALDLICVLPISEIMYSFFLKSEGVWYIHHVYSIPKLIRFIRLFKISHYLKNIHLFLVFKIVKTIVPFFLLVHWISCLWYLMVKLQYNADGTTETNWFPNSLRMIAPDASHLWNYYQDMSYIDVYGFTMLSVFMLMIGSDMAPTSQLQLYFTVLIGMLGVLSFAYVAALVTYIISKRNQKDSEYQQKREELQNKLEVNHIPHNLRDKVMEYFNYTWKKNKIFRNLSDFTELSLPLQRDLAFYLNKNLITNVPLFFELEPIEILSIIHKLKTCIYMPGDKIIRRGERGNEMYFIQEGTVEVVIKIANPDPKSLNPTNYTKVFLEKDNYFGEIALFSNSKRTSDVNAHEFCVLESFSRVDYNQLKNDFPDIITRLKAGLRYYKTHRAGKIIAILKRSPFFEDFADYEIQAVVETYMEEIFVDPEKIILRPKNKTNCLYFVFLGNVNSYADNSETREYLSNLQKINRGEKLGAPDGDEEVLLECLDDELVGDIADKFMSNSTKKKKLDILKSFSYGDYFGSVDLDENDTVTDHYFLSDSGCQLGAITNSLMEDLALDIPYLYQKLRFNILKNSPKKRMEGAIREEFDSFTVASHRRFSKQGLGQVKVAPTARFVEGSRRNSIPTVILEDGVQGFKEQLDKLQSDVDNFKNNFNNIDQKLSQLLGMKNNEPEKTESKVLVKEKRLVEACTKKEEEDKTKSAPKRSRSMD